jgi:6-phosphogluconate dehydrogenase
MIHNGIEYGLMQAYAEGFDILRHAGDDAAGRAALQLRPRGHRGALAARQRCCVVAAGPHRDRACAGPRLDGYSGFVQDSGEGRWTLLAAIEEAVPADVLSASLYARFRSRQDHTFAEKLLSAMRKQFGGHVEPK